MEKAPIPPAFLSRMESLLGSEYPEFLHSLGQPPSIGLRVNTLKISPPTFQDLLPLTQEPVSWCSYGFIVRSGPHLGKHPYHAAGLYYLQEPSAMLPVELLDPQPGERVLDLAAAPGGKSTQIATRMNNRGILVANEIHPRRVWELSENLERFGITNSVITNEIPRRIADRLGGFFDKVLLDAPCSGEGMFRRSEHARRDWSPEHVDSCAIRQQGILHEAGRLVRAGGILVYSTCTFAPEENEGVIASFLQSHPNFELVVVQQRDGISPGQPEWVSEAQASTEKLIHTVRVWPHQSQGEGHFVAVLRCMHRAEHARFPIQNKNKLPQESAAQFDAFVKENLQIRFPDKQIAQVGSYLYQNPANSPDLNGLRVIHPGWWLGVLKKNRFEPAHALAMGITGDYAMRQFNLSSNQPEVSDYLKGLSLQSAQVKINQMETACQPEGWSLVTIDGFPLGWGKRVKGVIKNYYPSGLRRT
jgi:NOL1/NOP2/sun family putative RNA methylase